MKNPSNRRTTTTKMYTIRIRLIRSIKMTKIKATNSTKTIRMTNMKIKEPIQI